MTSVETTTATTGQTTAMLPVEFPIVTTENPTGITTPDINRPPVVESTGDKTVTQGTLLQFTIKASDPDGDSLEYSAANLPAGANFNIVSRTFKWTPYAAGAVASLVFTVTDGELVTSETVHITVTPFVPPLLENVNINSVPLNLIYYGVHTPDIDTRILAMRPQFVVMNTPHGLWGEIHGKSVLQDTAAFKAAGIKVIGYITAGYEGAGSTGNIEAKWTTLATNLQLIRNMAEIDGVDGVFIDECSADPGVGSRAYLKALTDLAHSYGLITWGNTGRREFDPWYFTDGGFDLMHSSENWQGQELSQVQRDWGHRISVTGFNPSYTARDAFNLTVNAWQKGLAYCYIGSTEYTSIPSWTEEYIKLITEYNRGRQFQPVPLDDQWFPANN